MVALCHDLVEGFGLFLGEAGQTEIVNNEQLRFENPADALLIRTFHPRRGQSPEEFGRRREQGRVTISTRPVSQGLG